MNASRSLRLAACCAALSAAQSVPAAAPDQPAPYPTRPIRFIVPLPPGGGADLVARLAAERLSKNLGQQVIIDNRPGGGTVIGAETAARAAPDGHTLLLGTATTHAINASLIRKLPYDPVKDFAPVCLIAVLPQIFVGHPSLQANTLQDVVAIARKRPGEILFATSGNGSANQLAVEMLKSATGINMVHVPDNGIARGIVDLLGGSVQFMSTTIAPVVAHVKTGRMKAYAVANSKRSTLLPDLPTTAESGAAGVEATSWNGILVPAGTPGAVVARLHAEFAAVMQLPDLRERMLAAGVEPAMNTPAEFAAFIKVETARYAKVVREAGVRVD